MSEATTPTIVATATCPECDAAINFERLPRRHEIVTCPDCGVELEVTAIDAAAGTVTLALAPEVEEDWGE